VEYTAIIKAHNVTGGQAEPQFKLGLIGHAMEQT
jgi:hypothetical protein